MLKGLEISILSCQDLERTFRIDSEFYSKDYIQLDKKLKTLHASNITDYATISDGNHMSISASFVKEGIPYYRGSDIYNLFIEQCPNPSHIPLSVFNMKTMRRSHLKKGDVLMSIVGAVIGNISLVTTDHDATCSCKLAIIRPLAVLSSEYIMTFLKSKMGQSQIQRFRRGSGQTGFILEDFDQLLIPKLNDKILSYILDVIHEVKRALVASVDKYNYCIKLLEEELNLSNWQPSQETTTTKAFSCTQSSNRWDAEYYQPKYTELFKQMDRISLIPLHKIVTIQKSIEPGSDMYEESGVPFVRVSDMSEYGLTEPNIHLDSNTFKDVIRPKKDTILLSKDGSVGIAYKVQDDLDVITSGAILHLSIFNDDFLPDYVTLVLNSIVGQMQAERDAGGSVIQHWKPSEIGNVLIPKLDKKIQQEISQLVQESFKLRAESKRLLEVAKRTVEIAIEEDEEKAIQYINEYGKSL